MHSDVIGGSINWVLIYKIVVAFGLRKSRNHLCVKRTQLSLTLARAYTVHKVQGQSLHTGFTSFHLHKQKYFNQGKMYVALSRIKSLETHF